MPLFAVVGSLGAGKTATLAFLGWNAWFTKRLRVYSNLHLFKVPYIHINSLEQLDKIKEAYVCFDELWVYCVSPDTEVLSEKIKEIKDIEINDYVFSFDIENLSLIKSKVSDIQKVENKNGFLIKTKNYELKCTDDHPFFVFDGEKIIEKKAEDIAIGDWCLVIDKIETNNKDLIDEATAQLIGYVMADGHIYYRYDKDWRVRKYVIQIDEGNYETAKKYAKFLEEKFNVKCTLNHLLNKKNYLTKNGFYRLRISNKKFIEDLVSKIGDALEKNKWGYKFIDIPQVIINSGNKVVGAFLKGFFDGDGCITTMDYVNSRGRCFDVRISTVLSYEKNNWIAKKIRWLLLRFGIKSYFCIENNNSFGSKKNFHAVTVKIADRNSIIKFYENIGFYSPNKQKKLEKAINYINSRKRDITFSDVLPLNKLLEKGIKKMCLLENISLSIIEHDIYNKEKIGMLRKSFKYNITENLLKRIILYLKSYNSFYSCQELVFIDNLLKSNLTLQQVKVKENITLPVAYDITVPKTSNFVANGFVVHNCDSRLSRSKKTMITSNILLKSRKRILTYVFSAQMIEQLDRRIRKVLDFTATPVMNVNESLCKVVIFRGGFPSPSTYMKTIYYKTPLVFQIFDTYQEVNIDMAEEGEGDNRIIFQENFNREHGYLCECFECNTKYFNTYEEADKYAEDYWIKLLKKYNGKIPI